MTPIPQSYALATGQAQITTKRRLTQIKEPQINPVKFCFARHGQSRKFAWANLFNRAKRRYDFY
ncbi:hypothetical protein KJ991_00910 [Patescibacteria group bacterium]|nr:hypothetical protein [Patescibacteria group bacterium]MBU4057794.1 hypothetical protein [Patescibacteria group bacterium]MBU4115970.1 hypothetical protein [Patescibacteria group bacterium]